MGAVDPEAGQKNGYTSPTKSNGILENVPFTPRRVDQGTSEFDTECLKFLKSCGGCIVDERHRGVNCLDKFFWLVLAGTIMYAGYHWVRKFNGWFFCSSQLLTVTLFLSSNKAKIWPINDQYIHT